MPPRSIMIENRVPIKVDKPVSEDDINTFMSCITEMFPDLDVIKLQKPHTGKNVSYNKWKETHCREKVHISDQEV